jgi:uncharacterized protein YndB with AHSA1/START domain
MTEPREQETTVRGTLGVSSGRTVIRIELVTAAATDDVWAAVTESQRLAAWYGTVEGELRVGGSYHALLFPSGWDGTGKVVECDPGRRFLVESAEPGQQPVTDELELTPEDGGFSRVVLTKRGAPREMIAAYGVGTQLHLENLEAYLTGRELVEPDSFWTELLPEYERLAAAV